jgi:di/tricarboxylate transporter
MFGYDIGFFQWVTYCIPFVVVMIPVAWILINWLFKPRFHSLAPAMDHLRNEIVRMGRWNAKQIWALIIFVAMLFLWFTEKDLYEAGILPIRMGVGVVAVGGAIAYLPAGVVNWRDYQQKVDWGVVWLYAGAIIFGRTLDSTGATSSFAYCLIIGTPPNAIIYSSGYVTAKDFLRMGVTLWVASQIVLLALNAFYWQFRGFGGLPGF